MLFFWISLPDTFLTGRNWLNISAAGQHADGGRGVHDDHRHGDGRLRPVSVGSMASLAGDRRRHPVQRWAFRSPSAVAIGAGWSGWLGGADQRRPGQPRSASCPSSRRLATLTVFSAVVAFLISGGKTIFGRDIPARLFSAFARGRHSDLNDDRRRSHSSLPYLTIARAGRLSCVVWALLEQTTFGRQALRDRRQRRSGPARAECGSSGCGSPPSR